MRISNKLCINSFKMFSNRNFILYKKFMNYSNRSINNTRISLNINSTSSLKTSLLKYGAEYKKSNGRRGYITPPYKCPVLSNII